MTTNTQRLEVIDALRGFTLLGLFLVHMVEYFAMYHVSPEPATSFGRELIYLLFSGKAFAAFAFLFGLSFFIIMSRQAQRGVDFRKRFCWRLTLLLGFGWLHGLMYFGDVLASLALSGFLLVLVYKWSTRAVLLLSSIFLLQIPTLVYLTGHLILGIEPQGPPFAFSFIGDSYDFYKNGNVWQVLFANLWQSQLGILVYGVEGSRGSVIVGMFLLGYVIGRLGWVHKVEEHKQQLVTALVGCLLFGSIFQILQNLCEANPLPHFGQFFLFNSILSIKNVSFTLMALSLFVLAFQWRHFAKPISLLKPTGRMTLTLYISQSYICVPLFYGFGLGLYKTITPNEAISLGVALFALQLAFAHLWLKHYRYGPLEGLWRKATMWRSHTINTTPLTSSNQNT